MTDVNLFELQKRQVAHDRDFHRDIFFLPYPQRMTHFALHFAKYVGRLAPGSLTVDRAHQTLADSFIVALAASDVLNVNLDKVMQERLGKSPLREIEREAALRASLPSDVDALSREWALRLAVPTGEMGKALEALDHMEPLDVRGVLARSLAAIVELNLAVAGTLGVRTEDLVTARWNEIERRRLL